MSGVKAAFICALAVIPSTHAATFVPDGQKMRREPRASAVQLNSRGDLIEKKRDTGDAFIAANADDFCKYDYPLGKEGSKADCSDATKHSIILNEEMCIKAAQEAGATTPTGTFSLNHFDFNNHPKGCFYEKGCKEDPKGNCYFFNGVEPLPTGTGQMDGTPVCSRPKYLNGTADSKGADEAGCEEGYEAIMDETQCAAASNCLGHCQATYFRIGDSNATRHMDFPEGCFIHHKVAGEDEMGCVYFNAPSPLGKPSSPKGTPICKVKSPTKFTAVATPAAATPAAATPAAETPAAETPAAETPAAETPAAN